jgi:hypothetical protein
MQVFSGLLKPQGAAPQGQRSARHSLRRASTRQTSPTEERRPASGSSKGSEDSKHDTLYISDKAQLADADEEDPDLRELNASLVALAAIFPDIQVEVFREMLASFDEESRLAVVTEALLKHNMKWVKGRYRVASKDSADTDPAPLRRAGGSGVAVEERFRSAQYKNAVKNVTYQEFKGLSKSTINAVLAESNYSYMTARPTLVALSSKSWRFSISSLFLRRKQTSFFDAQHHPLVVWQSSGKGSIYPTLKITGSAELDHELFEALIVPLKQQASIDREEKDRALALELNEKEAEEHEALHDCECCFTPVTFEELAACNEGHPVCFRCVRLAITEAVFGQGWQSSINIQIGSLRCLAPMADDCRGCISRELVQRSLLYEKGGDDILRKLDERIAEDNLLKAQVPLVRCPFCSYAEVDELYLPSAQQTWHFKPHNLFAYSTFLFLVLSVIMIPVILPFIVLLSFVVILLSFHPPSCVFFQRHFQNALTRLRRRQHGLKFTCRNPSCARSSCISCTKAWTDIHICHESSLQALRTQVELAMSLAIKRTCPKCNTSFVKSSGCNKLTCVCGYQMCYVCRKDIGSGEGYRHFCEHFRPTGSRGCTECVKCDLYRCEDDEIVLQRAKEDAERAWLEKEGAELNKDVKTRQALEGKIPKRGAWWELEKILRWPEWETVVDIIVEAIIE